MERPFKTRGDVDAWYDVTVQGLTRGIKSEVAKNGFARFRRLQHLSHYTVVLEAANAIKRNLYECFKVKEKAAVFDISQLIALS